LHNLPSKNAAPEARPASHPCHVACTISMMFLRSVTMC